MLRLNFLIDQKKLIHDDDTWDFLEKSLLRSLKNLNLEFNVNKGEGAFYGPKIEFVLVDAIGENGNVEHCSRFKFTSRLGANFIDKDGSKKHPVMLHRAFFGS